MRASMDNTINCLIQWIAELWKFSHSIAFSSTNFIRWRMVCMVPIKLIWKCIYTNCQTNINICTKGCRWCIHFSEYIFYIWVKLLYLSNVYGVRTFHSIYFNLFTYKWNAIKISAKFSHVNFFPLSRLRRFFSYFFFQYTKTNKKYLHINVLAQIIMAMTKSRDGVNTPDASNSSSQFMPV